MKVAMLPMEFRAGTTVATLFTGMALAYKQQRNTMICYTGDNPAIKRYIGRDLESEDTTRSITQVAKLLQANAISPDELESYAIKVGTNLHLLDSYAESITPEELLEIVTFVYRRSKADYTLCDLTDGPDDPISMSILEASDVIVCISESTYSGLKRVADYAKQYPKLWETKHHMLLIDRYDDAIAPLKKMAALAGVPMRNTCKIHFNPYITKSCWNRDIQSCALAAYEHDPRVLELALDFKEISEFLLSINREKSRWEG